jgi:hypothetical protein
MNQSLRNANWNCNFLLQNNKPRFNPMAKKVCKTEKFLNLVSSKGTALAKFNQSNLNVNWDCNSLLQSNKTSFNPIAAKMANQVRKTENFLNSSKFQGRNSCKN